MISIGRTFKGLRVWLFDLIPVSNRRRLLQAQLNLDPRLSFDEVQLAVMELIKEAVKEGRNTIRLIRIPRASPEFNRSGNSLQTLCGLSSMYRLAAEALNLRVEVFELKMIDNRDRRRCGLPADVEWSFKDNRGRNSPSHFDLIARMS